MERAKLRAVNPVVPTRDVRAAIDFYVTHLGFSLRFQDSVEEPRYAGLRRDDVELHLQWHDPQECKALERPSLRETVWGTREFAFFGQDQNGLTFYCDS